MYLYRYNDSARLPGVSELMIQQARSMIATRVQHLVLDLLECGMNDGMSAAPLKRPPHLLSHTFTGLHTNAF